MHALPPDQQWRWLTSESRRVDSLQRRYRKAYLQALLADSLARFRGRSNALQSLDALLAGRPLRGSTSVGLRSVPIAAIVASEGREGDFDSWFRPLRDESWDRWRSVAQALIEGIALPPVELLAVEGRYAVRDGHHRISAAAALGQRDVDALITLLEV
jgi:hypothetical protein